MRAILALALGGIIFGSSGLLGAEKVKFGLAAKTMPPQYLSVIAAEEQGIWKKNGLQGEWFGLEGGGPFVRAMAAKSITIGYAGAADTILAVSRGLPLIIVSEHYASEYSYFVLGKSPIREPKDLKGAKVGVHALGGATWASAKIGARALGLEKEIKFIAVGGARTRLGALKAGAIDVTVSTFESVVELLIKGELREVVTISDYFPKPWLGTHLVARRDSVKDEAGVVGRVVKASLESIRFVLENRPWAIERMKANNAFSEEAAKLVHEKMRGRFTKDGRIAPKSVENYVNFLVEFGLIRKEEAPKVEEVYTNQFVQ